MSKDYIAYVTKSSSRENVKYKQLKMRYDTTAMWDTCTNTSAFTVSVFPVHSPRSSLWYLQKGVSTSSVTNSFREK